MLNIFENIFNKEFFERYKKGELSARWIVRIRAGIFGFFIAFIFYFLAYLIN